jgi:hypothetical protein
MSGLPLMMVLVMEEKDLFEIPRIWTSEAHGSACEFRMNCVVDA